MICTVYTSYRNFGLLKAMRPRLSVALMLSIKLEEWIVIARIACEIPQQKTATVWTQLMLRKCDQIAQEKNDCLFA